jgi:hypothetical protein
LTTPCRDSRERRALPALPGAAREPRSISTLQARPVPTQNPFSPGERGVAPDTSDSEGGAGSRGAPGKSLDSRKRDGPAPAARSVVLCGLVSPSSDRPSSGGQTAPRRRPGTTGPATGPDADPPASPAARRTIRIGYFCAGAPLAIPGARDRKREAERGHAGGRALGRDAAAVLCAAETPNRSRGRGGARRWEALYGGASRRARGSRSAHGMWRLGPKRASARPRVAWVRRLHCRRTARPLRLGTSPAPDGRVSVESRRCAGRPRAGPGHVHPRTRRRRAARRSPRAFGHSTWRSSAAHCEAFVRLRDSSRPWRCLAPAHEFWRRRCRARSTCRR